MADQKLMFERGTPANTLSTFPTRRFLFVLDPRAVSGLHDPYQGVANLIVDLRSATFPVEVLILVPQYLAAVHAAIPDRVRPACVEVLQDEGGPPFEPDPSIEGPIRQRLLEDSAPGRKARGLLTFATSAQADGVVTNEPVLIDAMYLLRQHHLVRIVPEREFGDVVEVCARGHSIFWSAVDSDRHLTFDVYYQLAHRKAKRLFGWFRSIEGAIGNPDLKQYLHSLLVNRYPFLLLSRDLVRFYDIQRDYFTRRGLAMRFATAVGYYTATFYFHLWGLLDHLAVVAKYALNLPITERDCGIRSERFWKKFGPMMPGLQRFVESRRIREWIERMADMRHAAAHGTIALPTSAVFETEESRKSDDEIRVILRQERPLFYSMAPPEVIGREEPQMIWLWRIRKMKSLGPTMVALRGRDGRLYLRDPVVDIDYDLSYATAVMNAFLFRLFRHDS